MSTRPFLLASALLFLLVALAHATRVAMGVSVLIEDWPLPMAVSWVGTVVPLLLAGWGFRLARDAKHR